MQIRQLGIDTQYGLRGNCVNVPIDVDNNVSVLPRTRDELQTISVQLVRRMTDKKPYAFETIRPTKVFNAAKYLVNMPLYQYHNISLSENWLIDYNNDNNIDSLKNLQMKDLDKNCIDNECDEWEELPNNDDMLHIPNEETLLLDDFMGIKFAPGENRRPISILMDDDLEELAFPTIYCGQRRNLKVKLSLVQIAKSEARMYDRRCAQSIPKLMLSFCRTRIQKLTSNIQISLRKKRQTKVVTVCDAVDDNFIQGLIQQNDGYRILQVDRSSPAFWEYKKKTVFSMIRQYGMPTIFLTISAAEMKWNELLVILKKVVDNENFTEDECEKLPWQEKCRLIQSDPITCARFYNNRVQEFIKLLKFKNGIFLNHFVIHYYYRIEFQHRGSPHIHCIIWLKDAPIFNSNDPHSFGICEKFIDEYITCENDDSISNLISYQIHKHSKSCKKNNKNNDHNSCRFGFPQFPMSKTKILMPKNLSELPKDFRKSVEDKFAKIKKVITLISQKKINNVSNMNDFLKLLNLNEHQYISIIQHNITRPTVFLKRDINSIRINAYNKLILLLVKCNIDIQFILDPYACINYIINYIGKGQKGLSKQGRTLHERML